MADPKAQVDSITELLRPLEKAVNEAWWDAAVSGTKDAYDRLTAAHNAYDAFLADTSRFRALEAARSNGIDDPLLARTIEVLYLTALPKQVDVALSERINTLASDVERTFSVYRPEYEGALHSIGDLEVVLRHERDETKCRAAWEATKAVGPKLAAHLSELVELRNRAAREVGYPDYYHLQLAVHEQDPDEIDRFFEAIDTGTEAAFTAVKATIDERLAERFGTPADELMPWHYEDLFFQEAPAVFGADLDYVYDDVDILAVARDFFTGIGLDVNAILERSSLYEAPGKDPHAFATDIDRDGDVRILLNLRANERWMGTTLHELGHAVYDAGIDRQLPWALRTPAHTLTTEAIAMWFGRLSRDPAWMRTSGALDGAAPERLDRAAPEELRAHMLLLARWVLVMNRFERALYADPSQDLNALWWGLVERYQQLNAPPRPEQAADYGAKIHVVAAPVYYHNYLYGECFASQLDARLREDVLDGSGAVGNPRLGEWLTVNVFSPGNRWNYDQLALRATGEKVTPTAFVEQFVA